MSFTSNFLLLKHDWFNYKKNYLFVKFFNIFFVFKCRVEVHKFNFVVGSKVIDKFTKINYLLVGLIPAKLGWPILIQKIYFNLLLYCMPSHLMRFDK